MPELGNDWLYHRVPLTGPDAADSGDAVLREVVGPAVGRLPPDVGARWFFVRFRDVTGMHLRLRLRAPLDVLAAAEDELRVRLSSSGRRHDESLYSPETMKFGEGPGMRLAEELFEASSVLALEIVCADAPRVATAAAQMLDLIAGLPPASRAGFLHQYAWYWSGGPARGPTAGPEQPVRSEQVRAVVERVREVRAQPRIAAALRRHRDAFATASDGELRHLVPRSEPFLRFHHLHLTNNRLGVFPGTEAPLARLLWRGALDGLLDRAA
jgi:thiopeptide-type bacteriocin biosynthesis protein